MKENIMVLGSTGSIGTQTLDVVRRNKDINIVSLAAGGNIDLLEQQIIEFAPEAACVYQEDKVLELKKRLKGGKTEILTGMDGMVACATVPSGDMVVASVVGMIGILPVIEAVKAKKDIAFANKETLVTAGHIIMPLVREMGVNMLPVDSEHAAVFQCLNGERHGDIRKIILTASGGPFRGKSLKDLENVSVEDALKHPNWSMGKKVTIDSASLVNKGLEVMEARWLFDVPLEQIQVVIHPQSIIHSAVEYVDGGIMAQLGMPDMKLPIQYALFYPDRRALPGKRVDFFALGQLTFEEPDTETFRGLWLAYEAARTGGSLPTVFNAANEKAVSLFIQRKIGFLQIPELIEQSMGHHKVIENPSVEEILQAEAETYEYIKQVMN